MNMNRKLVQFEDQEKMIHELGAIILSTANNAIINNREFNFLMAGGKTPTAIYNHMKSFKTNWNYWHFWYSDERCPKSLLQDDLNSTMGQNYLFDFIPVPKENIHRIKIELGPQEAADNYAKELEKVGVFDFALLGLGEDGHTASLFPGLINKELDSRSTVYPVFDSPKSPSTRITLSTHRLSESNLVYFLAAGANKLKAIQLLIKGDTSIPATAITGHQSTKVFYLNK